MLHNDWKSYFRNSISILSSRFLLLLLVMKITIVLSRFCSQELHAFNEWFYYLITKEQWKSAPVITVITLPRISSFHWLKFYNTPAYTYSSIFFLSYLVQYFVLTNSNFWICFAVYQNELPLSGWQVFASVDCKTLVFAFSGNLRTIQFFFFINIENWILTLSSWSHCI